MNNNNPTPMTPIQKSIMAAISRQHFMEDLKKIFRFRRNPEATARLFLFFVGTILSALTLLGALLGFKRAYARIMQPKGDVPRLHDLPLAVKFALVAGALLIWVVAYLALQLFGFIAGNQGLSNGTVLLYLFINFTLSCIVYFFFRNWYVSNRNVAVYLESGGTADYAKKEDLQAFMNGEPGHRVGEGVIVPAGQHILCVAGAGAGKSQSMIIANLLGVGKYSFSWVVLDPKGELCAVTANSLRNRGYNVIVINAWSLLAGIITGNCSYNPLDIVSDTSDPNLIDNIQVLAQTIIPPTGDDKNRFFTDSARNILASLILHLMTKPDVKERTLGTLWAWCRKSGTEWDEILADMKFSQDPVNGEAIRNSANEIIKMQEGASETFSSIISTVLESTNIFKSSVLQDSLKSDFNPSDLTKEKTAVFIVFPADKLDSHGSYLRILITSMIRSVIRKPGKPVTFLCDEAASLGYMTEIPTACAAYRGFGVNMWLVYQDLAQMKSIFGDRFESILSNCSVRMFSGIRDNFTSDYVSAAMGVTTHVTYERNWFGVVKDIRDQTRMLATADEVKRMSGRGWIVFLAEHPVAFFPKAPYYYLPELKAPDGSNLYDLNPYVPNSL